MKLILERYMKHLPEYKQVTIFECDNIQEAEIALDAVIAQNKQLKENYQSVFEHTEYFQPVTLFGMYVDDSELFVNKIDTLDNWINNHSYIKRTIQETEEDEMNLYIKLQSKYGELKY